MPHETPLYRHMALCGLALKKISKGREISRPLLVYSALFYQHIAGFVQIAAAHAHHQITGAGMGLYPVGGAL